MEEISTGIIINEDFLITHLHEIQFAAIFGGMVVLFLLESFIPRKKLEADQTVRWLSNIGLALFNYFFLLFYILFVMSLVAKYAPQSPFLQSLKLTDITMFMIVLLIMEFIYYWLHRVYHKVSLLWRIHAVHHTDTEVDVTTSQRHHPFEMVLSSLVITPVILFLGAPLMLIAVYNLVNLAANLITHSNIKVPEKFERRLRFIIVTPDFHRVHHSSDKVYTDSNYSTVIPLFDYLFKTAKYISYKDVPKIESGLKILRKKADNRIDKMLITPFNRFHN